MKTAFTLFALVSACCLSPLTTLTASVPAWGDPPVVEIDGHFQEHLIVPKAAEQVLTIHHLIVGESYKLSVPVMGCMPQIEVDGKVNAILSADGLLQTQTFVATATTHSFRMLYPCEWNDAKFPRRHFIAITCETCVKKELEDFIESQSAVLQATPGASADSLIRNVLIGNNCFDVKNVIYPRGLAHQIGTFSNGTDNIGIASGMIMSTASVNVAIGPNNRANAQFPPHLGVAIPFPEDQDLYNLPGYDPANGQLDMAKIEFDFTPTDSVVSFEYVFATEEYCEYVGNIYNDVFGFFISGPGITGKKNIAVVPNTTTPISVNTVNHLTNSAFYRHNSIVNAGPNGTSCPGLGPANPAAVNEVQFDGFTTVLTATANVIPCSTYHIKLVIANVSDNLLDAAVFLRAGSFNAGGAATPQWVVNNKPDSSMSSEGCDNVGLTFRRIGSNTTDTLRVPVIVEGTATRNVDYTGIPDTIVIPKNLLQVTIPVSILRDSFVEGDETIIVKLVDSCDCVNPQRLLTIKDYTPVVSGVPPFLCTGDTAMLSVGAYSSYLWSPGGQTTQSITITSPGVYSVIVTDNTGCTASNAILVPSGNLYADIGTNAPVCEGQALSLFSSPYNGVMPFSYEWSGPGGFSTTDQSPVINNATPAMSGLYTVTITDGNGCSGSASILATVNPLPSATIAETDNSCTPDDGIIQTGASATLTASGGSSYLWDDNSTNPVRMVSPVATTNYSVTVTDANGCTDAGALQIQVVNPPTAAIAETDNSCVPNDGIIASSGSATLTASGGSSYLWDDNSTNPVRVVSPVATTNYSVTVTDANGCTDSESRQVQVVAPPTAAIAETDNSCTLNDGIIQTGGSATLTASGGSSYLWDDNSTNPARVVNPVATTNYSVTVTDAGGCTDVESRQVQVVAPPTAAIAETDNSCTPNDGIIQTGGSATLTASGGSSYLWDDNSTNPVRVVSPLVTTNYAVTVTDANGCTDSESRQVQVVVPPTAAIAETDNSCTPNDGIIQTGGSATLTAAGGSSYLWDDNSTNPVRIVNPVATTNYSVTVTDANGCTDAESRQVQVVAPPMAAIAETDNSCTPNDAIVQTGSSATLTASGGSSYLWEDNSTNPVRVVSPLVTTNYAVTVTDVNGCTDTESRQVQVVAPPNAVITETDNSCTPNDGIILAGSAATLTASGGSSYLWDDNSTNPVRVVSPVVTTNYAVTVTDANGCTDVESRQVQVVAPPTAAIAEADNSCTPNDGIIQTGGSATLTAIGGGAYLWDDNSTTPLRVVSPVSTTTYSVTVTNAVGCTDDISFQIQVVNPPVAGISETDNSCTPNDFVIQTGSSATLTANGGFSYRWEDNSTNPVRVVSPLATTNYAVTVTDVNGCTGASALQIQVVNPPTAAITVTDNSCTPDDGVLEWGGVAVMTASGGIFYLWDDNTINPVRAVSPIDTTIYSVTVTDANGCTNATTIEILVVVPMVVEIDETDNSCKPNDLIVQSGEAATLTVLVNEPSRPKAFQSSLSNSFLWDDNSTNSIRVVNPLITTTYFVTVTDMFGCTGTAFIQIQVVNPLVSDISQTDNSCTPNDKIIQTGGTATLTVSGGSSYLWDDNSTDPVRIVSPVTTTNYTVTVTDVNGCTDVNALQIQVVNAPTAVLEAADNSCTPDDAFVQAGDMATLTAGGGSSYLWDDNSTNPVRVVSPPATTNYSVTISDGNGCTSTETVTITVPALALSLAAIPTNSVDCLSPNGAIDITATGGTGGYLYNWADVAGSNDPEDRSALGAGTYSVTVTDATGCTDMIEANLTAPNAPSVTTVHTDVLCFGSSTGGIDITASGGTPGYTYDWSDLPGADDPEDRSGVGSGAYILTITDAAGCSVTTLINVSQPAAALAAGAVPVHLLCNGGSTGEINLIVSGGTTGYTYDWADLAGADDPEDRTNLGAATYNVTVTDANGCTIATATSVNEPPALNLTTTPVNALCNGDNNGSINLSVGGGTSPYSFNWGAGQPTTEDRSALGAGNYAVTVTDNNNCTAIASATITEPDVLGLATTAENVLCKGGNSGAVDLSVSGGTSPYAFNWGAGQPTTEDRSALAAGSYAVTVTDNNNCTATISANISEPDALELSTTTADVLCNGGSSGTIDLSVNGGVSPYSFNWGAGQPTTEDRSALSAGNFTVTVTDNNGCTSTTSAAITEPAALALSSTQENVLCNGNNSGAIDLSVTGGTSPYTFDWGAGQPTTEDRSGLAAGAYPVTVTDNNGCTVSLAVTIAEPASALSLNAAQTDIPCSGAPSGSIDLSISGGTPAYIYDWADIAGNNDQEDRSGLAAGAYTVTATDANGCTVTGNFILNVGSAPGDTANAGTDVLLCQQSTSTALAAAPPASPGVTGTWTQSAAQALSGIVIANPSSPTTQVTGLKPGFVYEFRWTLSTALCGDYSSDLVQINLTLEQADAGPDLQTCPQSPEALLQANLPAGASGGQWNVTGGVAVIESPTSPETEVTGLSVGANFFVWTLSAPGCANYSADTVVVVAYGSLDAQDDIFFNLGQSSTLRLEVLANDLLPNSPQIEVSASAPAPAGLTNNGDGSFTFNFGSTIAKEVIFTYQVCAADCPGLCDVASVTILSDQNDIDPPLAPRDSLPNVITPSTTPGIGDYFVIPGNPEDYPNGIELTIVNRWGNVVYQDKNYANDWDGKNNKGQELPDGTYYYVIRAGVQDEYVRYGPITIVR